MSPPTPILIVGQGLAGSLLAWHLLRRGQPVRVVDDGDADGASRVAAGLINPITGKRLSLAGRTPALLRQALGDYRRLQTVVGKRLYRPLPLLRRIADERQAEYRARRAADPAYRAYLGRYHPPGTADQPIPLPLGGIGIRHCGQLDTAALLDGLRRWLAGQDALETTRFDHADLDPDRSRPRWRGRSWARVVFCEGHAASANPWFGQLPFQPCQGEILTLRSHDPLPRKVFSDGRWLVPLDPHTCRVGATTRWQPLDRRCTTEARESLLGWAEALFHRSPGFEVVQQHCGIRPALRGALPVLGEHPTRPGLAIVNGLGARGSLWAPWCARRLAEHLVDGRALPAELSPARFAPTEP